MEIEGKVTQIFDEVTGISKSNNEWRKREFLIATPGTYSRTVLITCFGDRASMLDNIIEGEEVTVSVDVESREFNGRWYTNVNAYRIQKGYVAQASAQAVGNASTATPGFSSYNITAPNFDNQPKVSSDDNQNQFDQGADDLPF